MMKAFLKSVLATVPICVGATPLAAAVLVLDGEGKLAGARDVIVAGQAYDVTFVDGTCAEAFGSCTNGAFTFRTQATAAAAAQALLDQVFIDTRINGTFYRFDQLVDRTVGCAHPSFCMAAIPVETAFNGSAVSIVGARNGPSNASDFVSGLVQITAASSQATNSQLVYARFVAAAPAVPEPAAWAMMLTGFGGIGVAMRRRPRNRTRVIVA